MEKLYELVSLVAGWLGALVCLVAGVSRLAGVDDLAGVEPIALFIVGSALMVFAVFLKLELVYQKVK